MSQYNKIYSYDNWFSPKTYFLPVGELLQVAELSVVPKGEIASHMQICDELTYVISGKAKILSNGKTEDIKSGQIHYLKKGLEHQIIADDNEAFRYVCIGVNLNREYEAIKAFNDMLKEESFFADDDGTVRSLTALLVDEFYLKDENSDVMINAYLTQIFIALSRLYKKQENNKKRKKDYNCKASDLTLYGILRYIDREYINMVSVTEAAQNLSYSGDYVSHLFKKKMGITMKEYLLKKKINTAKELLVTSDLKVEEIAEYLNFNSAHAFYQAFKKIVSKSPSEYKKENSGF